MERFWWRLQEEAVKENEEEEEGEGEIVVEWPMAMLLFKKA